MVAPARSRSPVRCFAAAAWLVGLLAGAAGAGGDAGAPPFRDATEAAGLSEPGHERGIAWGDFDGDGLPDIFVAVIDGPDRLFRNLGGGRFAPETTAVSEAAPGRSACGAWADFDADGDLDLFVGRAGANSLYRNDGGGFTDVRAAAGLSDSLLTWGAAWSDFDGDGLLDLYVVNFVAPPNRLYRNLGGGRFADVAAAVGVADPGQGTTAAWSDYDGDGDLDLYVANTAGPDRLFRNDGGVSFTDVTEGAGLLDLSDSIAAAWGDVDNDGDPDLFVAKDKAVNALYVNGGDGTFVESAEAAGLARRGASRGAGWGDADNDGDLDLYLAASDGPNLFYLNDGTGRFREAGAAAGLADPGSGTATAWADMDGDGDLDLLLSNFGSPWRLFANEAQSTGGWLEVELAAPGANRHAVGARVRVHAAGAVFTREQTTGGGGYQSQSPHVLHFGLGAAAPVDSVVVAWPRGGTTRLVAPGGDRLLKIRQP